MPTAYTPPDPAELALLLQGTQFQHPSQQPIFAAYAAGDIGIETTIFQLVHEGLERAPLEAAQRAQDAAIRAEQARIEAEMTANDTADSPTFIPVVVAGKPVVQPVADTPLVEPVASAASAPDEEEPAETETASQVESSNYEDMDSWAPGTSTGEEEENDADLRGDD